MDTHCNFVAYKYNNASNAACMCSVVGGGGGTRGWEPGSNGNGKSTVGRISKGGELGEKLFATLCTHRWEPLWKGVGTVSTCYTKREVRNPLSPPPPPIVASCILAFRLG